MADVFLVKRRIRLMLWIVGVGVVAGAGAILYFRQQMAFGDPATHLAAAVVATGALAATWLGLLLLYYLAPRLVEPPASHGGNSTKWILVPGWVVSCVLLLAFIAGMAFVLSRLSRRHSDPFALLQDGQINALETLVAGDPGLLVSTNKNSGKTLLRMAVETGNLAAAEMLVQRGASAQRGVSEAQSLLWLALDQPPMLAVILQGGADPNQPDAAGIPPLLHAVAAQNTNALLVLIEHGARLDVRDGALRTPLFYAAVVGSVPSAALILDRGADPNLCDRAGNTALHQAVLKLNLEMARLLLEKGADPRLSNAEGMCPIHIAARSGNREMTELLLCAPEMVDLRGTADITPFEYALRHRHYDLAQDLIVRGADVNRVRKDGHTLLHAFLLERDYKPAEFMVKAGADETIVAADGTTALDLMREKQLESLLKLVEAQRAAGQP